MEIMMNASIGKRMWGLLIPSWEDDQCLEENESCRYFHGRIVSISP